jgi:hypothetical protein
MICEEIPVASGISPDVEPGSLPGGLWPGGGTPPSTAGKMPAATRRFRLAQSWRIPDRAKHN